MVTIKVVCVGSIKEKFYAMAIDEYVKRLSKFAKVVIKELPETKIVDKPSEKNIEQVKASETQKIIDNLEGYVVLLDLSGKPLTSEELALKIEQTMQTSSVITFVIGGSYGFLSSLKQYADFTLSFSHFTFPHQLMRVVLLEQIYRAFTITNNITYHK